MKHRIADNEETRFAALERQWARKVLSEPDRAAINGLQMHDIARETLASAEVVLFDPKHARFIP